MSITEKLENIECGEDRETALIGIHRDTLVSELYCLGFDRSPAQAVPTDWAEYYSDDELRGFVLEYANAFSEAA